MTLVRYSELVVLKKGDSCIFHYQELNPPDRSRAEMLELRWEHDRVEGDLAFGSLRIPGIGELDLDAYVYRPLAFHEDAWLSSIDLGGDIGGPSRRLLTGGPLHKERLLPSEVSARSDRRDQTARSGERLVPFLAEEYEGIRRWQNGMNEKGFECNFDLGPYVEHKRTMFQNLFTSIEKEGLECNLEIRRLRLGFRRFEYSVWCSDGSFRRPDANPFVKRARPASTSFLVERCQTFRALLKVMDKAIDDLVLRNQRHLR